MDLGVATRVAAEAFSLSSAAFTHDVTLGTRALKANAHVRASGCRMLRAMKRIVIAAALFGVLGVLVGCDEDKKKEELLAKAGAGASASASAAPAPAAPAPTTPPAASVEAPKKEVLCPTGPELTIADPDLEAALRFKLSKPKDRLKTTDLPNVRSLNLTQKKSLDELDPCIIPKLTSLKHLFLGPGKLRDLGPIANLTQMESLRASISEVEDLSPLAKLTLLDRLDLGRTHVRDLGPIANLVNLTELQLDDTPVTDLAPLAKCKKLERVSIKNTSVTDVSALKDLTKLKFLYVGGTAISNLDTLQPLVARGLRVVTK